MVIGIIAAQVISIVLTLFTGSFSLLGAGLTIACCVALYRGVSWVRYAMAVLNLITLFLYFMIFVEAITLGQPLPAWFWLLFAVLFAVVAVQCALLFSAARFRNSCTDSQPGDDAFRRKASSRFDRISCDSSGRTSGTLPERFEVGGGLSAPFVRKQNRKVLCWLQSALRA